MARTSNDERVTPDIHEPPSAALLARMDAYWRAANYLSVGQIYLYDNPLLRRPLTLADVKPRLLKDFVTFKSFSLSQFS